MLAALILLGALALSALTLRDYVRSRMLNFSYAHEGSISITLPGEVLVLRNEYILEAPASGEFIPVAEEGERVKEGGLIGYCGDVALTARKGGAVSYELDGWEQKLQIAAIYDLDWRQIFQSLREEAVQAAQAPAKAEEMHTSAGRPVTRLVDNLLEYKVVLLLQDPRELLAEEKKITFSLPEGKLFTNAYSERWQTVNGDIYYIFTFSSREDVFFSLRYSKAEIIVREVYGIIIPSAAVIVDEEGRTGVFIQKKRKLAFTEITELSSKDGFSVVDGLGSTAVVVSNPAKATDGQRIYLGR
ncbi:MAG: hypothetical protein FWF04_00355 [Clostridiales bacterium]|nr:hypothetical protein [Clostridiales bacterium]